MCEISLSQLTPMPEEYNTTASLIRGVAAGFQELSCTVRGFDAYMESTVLPGSGLSSSAALEVLLGTIINHLFYEGQASAPMVAAIGQYAENVFFGKPCGLMDQMASSVGGMVSIDFQDPAVPVITPVEFDFSACAHVLCIIDTRASHAELTDEYAAITRDMKGISSYFGKKTLRQVDEDAFYQAISQLREGFGDRAVLRAMHFFRENQRVVQQVEALQQGNFPRYLELMTQSGQSSWMYVQNVTPTGATEHQEVALALALCQEFLQGRGGYRVHGGGFAGTVQALVPTDMAEQFRSKMDAVLGEGACHILSIRPQGGVEMK
jgi:galactokinase